jgi:hypothetical protein
MVINRFVILISIIGLYSCDQIQIPNWPSNSNLTSLPFYFEEGPKEGDKNNCRKKLQLNLQNLDWKKAKSIDIFSKYSGISPKKTLMNVNTPYVIKLYNGTNDNWNFQAENFFKNAAIEKIIYSGKIKKFLCIDLIRIGKLKWAEVHLVPLKIGVFNLKQENKFTLKNLFFSEKKSFSGQIVVQE